MTSGAGRTFTYNYDNMPTSIVYNSAATVSIYDISQYLKEKDNYIREIKKVYKEMENSQ